MKGEGIFNALGFFNESQDKHNFDTQVAFYSTCLIVSYALALFYASGFFNTSGDKPDFDTLVGFLFISCVV